MLVRKSGVTWMHLIICSQHTEKGLAQANRAYSALVCIDQLEIMNTKERKMKSIRLLLSAILITAVSASAGTVVQFGGGASNIY